MTYRTHHRPVFVNRQKGNIVLSLTIIFGLLFITVLYLSQVNDAVARNFELRAAQSVLKAKQEANQRLLVSLMGAKSLNNLTSAAKDLNLVAVGKVDYLKVAPDFFAFSQNP